MHALSGWGTLWARTGSDQALPVATSWPSWPWLWASWRACVVGVWAPEDERFADRDTLQVSGTRGGRGASITGRTLRARSGSSSSSSLSTTVPDAFSCSLRASSRERFITWRRLIVSLSARNKAPYGRKRLDSSAMRCSASVCSLRRHTVTREALGNAIHGAVFTPAWMNSSRVCPKGAGQQLITPL